MREFRLIDRVHGSVEHYGRLSRKTDPDATASLARVITTCRSVD
ncbi:hypothetical protein [Tautonia rosea]|nr:hypothetical protein [Tautonia rosea]